jgi:cob(I)alamin adenosyltransferase
MVVKLLRFLSGTFIGWSVQLMEKVTHESDPTKIPRRGLITVFMGDGKGKTTAAIGTAVRAAGYGLRVYIVFFMKGKMFSQGEVKFLGQFPYIKMATFGQRTWIKKGSVSEEAREQARAALDLARKIVADGENDLVILDEINGAVDFGLVPVKAVMEIALGKPHNVDLILTGRHADASLVQMADVVTEMVNVKHAFKRGIKAREGFDY